MFHFEQVSGLQVNFVKSCLIGVHIDDPLLDMAKGFMHYMWGILPFKYLGLPVGDILARVPLGTL